MSDQEALRMQLAEMKARAERAEKQLAEVIVASHLPYCKKGECNECGCGNQKKGPHCMFCLNPYPPPELKAELTTIVLLERIAAFEEALAEGKEKKQCI